jgi:2,4-dienoyl-CoA reductase-like NADH-dependent reductase (Old Yellow Enzyme family)
VNQFLSPFFNKRKDSWGGSNEDQFRFLKEVLLQTKKNIAEDMFVLVKLNTRDYTPREGITLEISKKYAEWLAELAIDGLELSCGTLTYSMFNMMRGEVPVNELITYFPWWRKVLGKMMLKKLEGKFDLEEGYNLEAAKLIKPVIGDIPLLAVGGLRKVSHMEKVLKNGSADFISMSRPFIREPNIVNRFREEKVNSVACVSCNKCFAAIANHMPLYCYNKGFPK